MSTRRTWDKKKAERRDQSKRVLEGSWSDDIRESLLGDAHPRQHDYAVDDARFVTAQVGRGGGKTSGDIIRKVIKATSIPNARLVYIALTKTQAENLYWAPLKLVFEQLGFRIGEDVLFNETKLTCTVPRTGATLRLVGADKKSEVEKLRGQPFHEVTIDEVASFPPKLLKYLIEDIITPRLGDYNGTLCLIGSPGNHKHGLFFEVTGDGQPKHRRYSERNRPEYRDWLGYSSHKWNLRDDVISLDDAEERYPRLCNLWRNHLREKAKEQWSDDNPKWRREYLGEWAEDDTENIFKYRASVNQWTPEIAALKGLGTGFAKLPGKVSDYLFGYGLDLGSRDPFALNILAASQVDPKRLFRHVFGFERRQMYPQEIAKLLIGEEAVLQVMRGNGIPDRLGGLFGVTGWPAVIIADLAGLGETVILELQKVYGITIKGAVKGRDYKHGAFEVVNGQLVDERLLVMAGSDLEIQLLNLQWKPDDYGQPREDKSAANHSSDSVVYVLPEMLTLFTSAPVEDTKDADDPYEANVSTNEQILEGFEDVSPGSDEYSWTTGDGDYHGL